MTTALDSAAPVADDTDPFRDGCSTAWPHRSASAATATPPSPTSSGTRAPRNARSTASSPARKSASSSCCGRTTRNLIARDPGGRRSRGGLAGPDPPGRRRLCRPHRVAAGDHAELDPRTARARARGSAGPTAGHGTDLTDHAGRSQRQPGVPARATATADAAAGGDPARRAARADRADRRRRRRSSRGIVEPARDGVDGTFGPQRSSPESAARTSPAGARCRRTRRSPCPRARARPHRAAPAHSITSGSVSGPSAAASRSRMSRPMRSRSTSTSGSLPSSAFVTAPANSGSSATNSAMCRSTSITRVARSADSCSAAAGPASRRQNTSATRCSLDEK